MIINKTQKSIMKKFFTLAAVAALVLSACAKVETEKPVVDEPIAFRIRSIRLSDHWRLHFFCRAQLHV